MKRIFLSLGVMALLFSLCSCDTYVGGYAGGPGYRPGYSRPYYSGYRSSYYSRPSYAWGAPSRSYVRPSHSHSHSRPHSYYRSSSYNRGHYHDWNRSRGARTNTRVNVGPVGVRSNSWLGL